MVDLSDDGEEEESSDREHQRHNNDLPQRYDSVIPSPQQKEQFSDDDRSKIVIQQQCNGTQR